MTRRAAIAGVIAATVALTATPADAATRPNVLVFVTDDQRARGTLDVMPATRRWFARGGRNFPNAFATTPLCCPSRASILTGNYAHNHYAFPNDINRAAAPYAYGREVQRYLKRAGYRTGIVGKYLNGYPLERRPPFFDRYVTHEAFYYRSRWNVQGRVRTVPGYSTVFARNRARELLREFDRGRRPWFLYVATNAPHGPLQVEPRHQGFDAGPFPENPATAESDLSDKPPWLSRLGQGRAYAEEVRRDQRRILRSADEMVDGIMRELRRLGEDRHTIALFLSDNGLFWGEHGGLGIKDLPYDAAVRIPLLLRWPGRVRSGRTDRRLVANIDVAPTILDAANVRGPSMDGRSLLARRSRNRLLLEYGGLGELIPAWASTLTRRSQYTEYFGFPGTRPTALPSGADLERSNGATFLEYYDLVADPFQTENRAARREPPVPPELASLASRLHRDMDCRGRSCP